MKSLLNALEEGRLLELPDTDKEKSLQFLAHILEAVPDLGGNPELAEAVIARERSQNTGIGLGVGCPHVRATGVGDVLCAVGWSPKGIDYGSPDGKPVHLVVMYYIPESQKNTYLKEVSGLARAVQKEGGIRPIADAEDLATVRNRLLDWVSTAIDAAMPEAKARMIRLEARQAAAEAVPLAPTALLQIIPVMFLALGERKPVALCQNADLCSALEREETLEPILRQRGQFDRAGHRFVFRAATAYEANRTLYEYLAVKLS